MPWTGSNRKGKVGEREAAAALRALGLAARRTQQYSGTEGTSDLTVPGLKIHWEVKRTNRLSLYEAIAQAVRDAKDDHAPLVLHRRDREEWLAVLRLDDLAEIVAKLQEYRHKSEDWDVILTEERLLNLPRGIVMDEYGKVPIER